MAFLGARVFLSVMLLLAVVVMTDAMPVANTNDDDASLRNAFTAFKLKHKKQYRNADEEALRFKAFSHNMRVVVPQLKQQHPEASFTAMSKFADLSNDEFRALRRARKGAANVRPAAAVPMTTAVSAADLASSAPAAPSRPAGPTLPAGTVRAQKNWVSEGAVSPAFNEGECGSVWAVAAVNQIASLRAASGGALIPLSIQSVVSCANNSLTQGCNGGEPDKAMEWIMTSQKGWLTSAATYPYDHAQMSGTVPVCQLPKPGVTQIVGFKKLAKTVPAVLDFVNKNGPVVADFDGGSSAVQMYDTGVLTCTKTDSNTVDTDGMIVGFNTLTTTGAPYVVVQNSWGTDWGQNGTISFALGTQYMCGLLTNEPVTAVLADNSKGDPAAGGYTPPPPTAAATDNSKLIHAEHIEYILAGVLGLVVLLLVGAVIMIMRSSSPSKDEPDNESMNYRNAN